jgi:hypothetical protein
LNIQRSYDSLKYYSTIFSATSPELPQNGFTDTKSPGNKAYYRIFYVLEGGSYFFTKVKRADGFSVENTAGTGHPVAKDVISLRDINRPNFNNVVPGDKRVVLVKIRDSLIRRLSINSFRNFRDSILRLTKDTMYAYNDSLVGLSPYVAKELFKASAFVYLNPDGYINVSLPAISEKKYNLKIFEENGSMLFEIHNIKESPLILDKSNFIHAGWFLFELYEDNKLKEKNKFYLPKDF